MAEKAPRNPRTIALKLNQQKPAGEPKVPPASEPNTLKEWGTESRTKSGGEPGGQPTPFTGLKG